MTVGATLDPNQRALQLHRQFSWLPSRTIYAFVDSGMTDDEIHYTTAHMAGAAKGAAASTALKVAGRKTDIKSKAKTESIVNQQYLQSVRSSGLYNDEQIAAIERKTRVAHAPAGTVQKEIEKNNKPTGNAWKVFFDDPVLQKHPSAALALKQWISGSIGNWPVQDKDLGHIQTQLQVAGFGRDLEANGVNSPGWDAALRDYREHVYHRQLSGDRPGGMSVGQALEAMQALTPTNAWNALVGFVTALPDGARQLVGDAAGGTVQLGVDLYHGSLWHPGGLNEQDREAGLEASYQANADVVNFLGGDTTPKEIRKSFEDNGGLRLLEDMTNIIMLTSIMGSAGRFANAVGIERAASAGVEGAQALTYNAAVRGPGVIAKSLSSSVGGSPVIPRTILGGVLGGGTATLAGGSPGQIALATVGGAGVGAFSNTKVFQNIPLLGNTGPMIDALADADGLYYKARALAAMPYRFKATRLADVAFQQSLVLGAEVRGLAQVQDWVGGDQSTPYSRAVENTHVIDGVNDAIAQRLGFTVLGQHLAPNVDDLMFAFSGRGAVALKHAPSDHLSSAATKFVQMGTDSLGETGFLSSIQHANGNKSLHTLFQEAGGQENFYNFWSNKIADQAAYFMAERRRGEDLLSGGWNPFEPISSQDRFDEIRRISHEIRNDPDQLQEALTALRAQHGGEELTARLVRETTLNRARLGNEPAADLAGYMDAYNYAAEKILPHVGERFYSPPIMLDLNAETAIPTVLEFPDRRFKYRPTVQVGETVHDGPVVLDGGPGDLFLSGTGKMEKGQLGLARKDTLTRQDAYRLANELGSERAGLMRRQQVARREGNVTSAMENVAPEIEAWNRKIDELLVTEFGIDVRRVPYKDEEKIGLIREVATNLAADVKVNPKAPKPLHDAVTELDRKGYKLVAGTDIGFLMHGPASVEIDAGLHFQRRVAEKLGLNPTMVPDAAVGTHRWAGQVNEIQKLVDGKKIRLPALADPTTILAYLKKEGVIDTSAPVKDAVRAIFRTPQRLAKRELRTVDDVQRELDQVLQIRDASRKRVVDALTDPEKWGSYVPASAEAQGEFRTIEQQLADVTRRGTSAVPPMTTRDAEAVYRAIVRGSAAPKAYMLGLSRLDDLFRASLGFAGKGLGNNRLGYAIANLPNKLVQLRNELRFDLSPYFSFRRIAKTDAKLAAEGVAPVVEPVSVMRNRGTLAADRDLIERLDPHLAQSAAQEAADSAGRYLESQDIFGLFNHRNYEAYAAGEWKRAGLTDDQIREKLVKVFNYGSHGVAGRSALERSTNFVFFPWSFDKTLYRNLGGYLLDKPAQRYLITAGIAAYDQFNKDHMDGKNPLATSFWTKHVPILEEATRLNALQHGISMGEVGGINRPLLNLFLPQSWTANSDNFKALTRFVPAIKDFQRVYGELLETGAIGQATFENAVRDLNGIEPTYGDPSKSTLTDNAQLEEAFSMYLDWQKALKDYTDFNATVRTGDAKDKYRFPLDDRWGKYAGEPITNSNIREIVALKYPAFSPEQAVINATSSSREFQQYLLDKKGTPLHDYIADFQKYALQLGRALDSDKYTSKQLAEQTTELRKAAIYISHKDSRFYSLYDSNFRRILGPLEGVQD